MTCRGSLVQFQYRDGSKEEFADGIQVKELLGKLPRSISKKAVAARIAGGVYDLDHEIVEGG